MQYRIFDLETENYVLNKRKASPFDPRNYIVAYGHIDRGDSSPSGIYCISSDDSSHANWYIPDHIDMLVGHNIKFDLLWIWEHPSTKAFLKRGGKIWCTQYAEYLLQGHQQHVQMNALGDVAIKYGGTAKYDPVKAMWEAGALTSEIDRDILMDYLLGSEEAGDGDIGNTHKVFLGQLKAAKELNMTTMIQARMDGLLATTEMEYNGLFIDKELGLTTAEAINSEIEALKTLLQEELPELPMELQFNWGSGYHLSALLFGGAIVYEKWVQHQDEDGNLLYAQKTIKEEMLDDDGEPIRFKSGKNKGSIRTRNVTVPDMDKPKGKLTEFLYTFDGFVEPRDEWRGKRVLRCGTPVYSTDADTIETIGKISTSSLPQNYAKLQKLSKDVETYYISADGEKGMLTLVDSEGIIHHSLNHTSTKTSRMSASNPNMQNIPRGDTSDVKKMFKSRFGDDGMMCEIDYSQLEVVVQALLTGDRQMIADVNDGVDFHCKRLAAKLEEPYEHVLRMCKVQHDEWYGDQRTGAKSFSFQRAYGAGVQAVMDSTGMSREDVEALILAEEKLYPDVLNFDGAVEKAINDSSKLPHMRKREAHPYIPNRFRAYCLGEWVAPSGTRYVWREWDAPDYVKRRTGRDMCFSPTERKNWPTQGTGGEFVQMVIGKLFRYFTKNDNWDGKALMVNTVHDCVWFDFASEKLAREIIPNIEKLMCAIPRMLKQLYNWDCPVKFTVESELGPDMYNLKFISKHTGETS